jgi:glutathione S-transferase
MARRDIILYDADGSPCARRVKISLMEKGVPFVVQKIDLSRLEQRSPAYLSINPNGLVPTLADDGQILWESNVITEYLDDVFPEKRLYPMDTELRLKAKYWQSRELELARDFRPLMYARLMGPLIRFAASHEEVMAKAMQSTDDKDYLAWESKVWHLTVLTPVQAENVGNALMTYVDELEDSLRDQAFLAGAAFSTADLSMYPRLSMYPYVGLPIDTRKYPRVSRWMRLLEGRPSFRASRSHMETGIRLLVDTGILADINRLVRGERVARPQTMILEKLVRPVLRRLLGYGRTLKPLSTELRRPSHVVQHPLVTATTLNFASPTGFTLSGDSRHVETAFLATLANALNIPLSLAQSDSSSFPRLIFNDHSISDVALASEILCANAGRMDLIGDDASKRAQVKMWMAFDAAMHKEFRPLHQIAVFNMRREDVRIDMGFEGALSVLGKRLQTIALAIESSGALVSNNLTVADLLLAIRVRAVLEMDHSLAVNNHERLADWLDRIDKQFVGRRDNLNIVAPLQA